MIGKGTFGKIYSIPNNRAMKVFEDFDIFMKELFYLSIFKNYPNICQIKSYDLKNKSITMEEYAWNLGELSLSLTDWERKTYIKSIVKQILNGLAQIHSKGIIHGDIKLSNIFCSYDRLTDDWKCYVGDFSLACLYGFNRNDRDKILFPPDSKLDKGIDIWMLGLAIYEFLNESKIPHNFNLKEKDFVNPCCINKFEFKCMELFTATDPEKRFSIETTNSISNNHNDLFQELNKKIEDADVSYYLSHNALIYFGMNSSKNEIISLSEKLSNYDLLAIFSSLHPFEIKILDFDFF